MDVLPPLPNGRDSTSFSLISEEIMDTIVKQPRSDSETRFDSARIAAAVEALATQHAGRDDVFRAAVAQLMKAELAAARGAAQRLLLKDRHGRRCAERLCLVQDEIIRILY